jgi:hypothetical protein
MAGVEKDGTVRIPKSKYSSHCVELNARGLPCGAWAIRGTDRCMRHSVSDEEWMEMALRGGKARAQQRREKAQLRDSSRNRHFVPGPTLARAVEVIHDLLTKTLPGTSEPNMECRAYGVLAVAQLFRLQSTSEVIELLSKVAPKVAKDPDVHRLLDLEATRKRLVKAYEDGRISAEELPPGVLRLDKPLREVI